MRDVDMPEIKKSYLSDMIFKRTLKSSGDQQPNRRCNFNKLKFLKKSLAKSIPVFLTLLLFFSSIIAAGQETSYGQETHDFQLTATDPNERIERYKDRYKDYFKADNELMSKITTNNGNGYEGLYGTRNFRVVLHGVLYRGGANNYYHRENPRRNENPLPADGLDNLCREGFGKAIYLYNVNFTPAQLQCEDRFGGANQLTYVQRSALGGWDIKKDILASIYQCTQGAGNCPIYTHCWNGWHASGFIAALALRQFCDFSGLEAVNYWIDGTDSVNNSNLPMIKKQIQEFSPYSEFKISEELKKRICPENPYHK